MPIMIIPIPRSKLVSIDEMNHQGAFNLLLTFLVDDIGFNSSFDATKARLREWVFEQHYGPSILMLVGTLLVYLHAHTSVLIALKVISQQHFIVKCEYKNSALQVHYE